MQYNNVDFDTYFKHFPDKDGFFGKYGGCYISEDLKRAMEEITEAYFTICKSSRFIGELRRIRRDFQGRPTPISHLERLSASLGNVRVMLSTKGGVVTAQLTTENEVVLAGDTMRSALNIIEQKERK